MEDLTKQQLVLLTLLVSFVTSIATGIITVALMNQVPQTVTQTINRVVERTIEKVVPATPVSTEKIIKETIVVKEEDRVVESISKNSDAVIRIYKTKAEGETSDSFVSLGTVISDDGKIVTDNFGIYSSSKYYGVFADGKQKNVSVIRSENREKVAFLKFDLAEGEATTTYKKSILAKTEPQLGQTVVLIAGESKNSVFTGIISSLNMKDIKVIVPVEPTASSTATTTEKTEKTLNSLETNISAQSLISGGPLLNLSGELIGIKVFSSEGERTGLFIPSASIKKIFDSISVLKTS